MNIGTAKPTDAERRGIPHHLIDFVDPGTEFSVADYTPLAHRAIGEIYRAGNLPIIAGGTGLYIDSVADNLQFSPMQGDPALRMQLQQRAKTLGGEYLLEELRSFDPESASRLHPNNLGRIIRAIEVYRVSGITMTEHQCRSRSVPSPYQVLYLGLNYRNRAILYERIDRRVEQMLECGLLDEVRVLLEQGYDRGTAGQAIGYKEFFDYLKGLSTLEQAVALVKQQSRRYAKRQLTWFGRNKDVHWFYPDEYEDYDALLQAAGDLIAGHWRGKLF